MLAQPVEKKKFYGRAVENGVIRFLSVSQVVAFDPSQEAGCPRRWFFQKVAGKKEEETAQQQAGKEYAQSLQHYEETGEDILVPVLRAGKHLLPKPGPDLECEKDLSLDIERAIALRELFVKEPSEATRLELERVALLTANNIPIVGAADVRHRRGNYVDTDGILRGEDKAMRVVEVIDLKTTSRISSHTSSSGKVQPGYAKTVEQILNHPQVVGYGVHASNLYKDTTHVRLGHIYCQTRNGYAATKRHGLLSVEETRRRWLRVESIAREMEDIAKVKQAEAVPYNLKACNAYNRPCPHMSYCVRPDASVTDLFQLSIQRAPTPVQIANNKGEVMSGLFGDLQAPAVPKNGTSQPSGGLFSSPPPVPLSDAQREAAIAAERARLVAEDSVPALPVVKHPLEGIEGYTVGQPCNGNGWYQGQSGGFLPVEKDHACVSCKRPAVPPPIDAVNPPDAPGVDPVSQIGVLPPEVIASITDTEVKAKAEALARAAAEREAVATPASMLPKAKASGRCSTGGQMFELNADEIAKKKKQCPSCGKKVKVTLTEAGNVGAMAPHNMAKMEAAEVPAMAPPPPPSVPALPVAAPPEPPPLPALNTQVVTITYCDRCARLEAENTILRKTIHTLTA